MTCLSELVHFTKRKSKEILFNVKYKHTDTNQMNETYSTNLSFHCTSQNEFLIGGVLFRSRSGCL